MRVLYIHPFFRDRWNVGDSVYYHGTRELLLEAIGEHEVVKGTMEDFKRDVTSVDNLDMDVDLIVTTGSPWLQADFHNNWMSKALVRLVARYKGVPKIAFGLGGCCGLNKSYYHNKKALEVTNSIFKEFNLVFTREPMTNQFMSLSNILAHNTLDSAVFFPMDKFALNKTISQDRPVMIYFDATTGISSHDFTKKEHEMLDGYYSYVYKKYNPSVYVVNEPEIESAKKAGINNAKWLCTLDDVITELASASFVISGRVHQATLAVLLGKKTYVIPYDIRYMCCSPIGAVPVFNKTTLSSLTYAGYKPYYKELLENSRKYIVNNVREVIK